MSERFLFLRGDDFSASTFAFAGIAQAFLPSTYEFMETRINSQWIKWITITTAISKGGGVVSCGEPLIKAARADKWRTLYCRYVTYCRHTLAIMFAKVSAALWWDAILV